ncbi:hypothetical protein GJ744_007189 [Endocarpon pusillum]|uniref:Uncharacterized protein n=1 Tax=Endocarpon pusillum TaxID=364733 RepID=A0A8H7E6C3_9EURO|nr:hypothetical protein GJ744_007189 [Endocarpon pusillum]
MVQTILALLRARRLEVIVPYKGDKGVCSQSVWSGTRVTEKQGNFSPIILYTTPNLHTTTTPPFLTVLFPNAYKAKTR